MVQVEDPPLPSRTPPTEIQMFLRIKAALRNSLNPFAEVITLCQFIDKVLEQCEKGDPNARIT